MVNQEDENQLLPLVLRADNTLASFHSSCLYFPSATLTVGRKEAILLQVGPVDTLI